jgi:hypothetical protein
LLVKTTRALAITLASCLLLACVDIRGASTSLSPPAEGTGTPSITVARDVQITLSTGYHRTLRQGTVWLAAGVIPEGSVYKPRDTVFSVEGTNVHEAYLVVSGGKLVGYYLPAEGSYVSQSQPIDIPIQ